MATLPLKINLVTVFNQVIEFINEVNHLHVTVEAEEGEDNVFQDLDWRGVSVLDVKFKIIADHLEKVGKRALELGDEELTQHLINVGVLHETKDEAPIADTAEPNQ